MRPLITPSEAAKRLCVPRHKIYQMVRDGSLDGVRVGVRTIRIYEDSLQGALTPAARNAS